MKHLLALLFTAILAGCASPIPKQLATLTAAPLCCTEIGQITSTPLSEKTTKAVIDGASSAFNFNQGKSYFLSYEPQGQKPKTLKLKTYHIGNSTFDSYVFCPTITFIDHQGNIQSSIKPSLQFERAGIFEGAFWWSTVSVPEKANRIVIHTSEDQLKSGLSSSSTSGGFGYMAGNSYVYVPQSTSSHTTRCSSVGKIALIDEQ